MRVVCTQVVPSDIHGRKHFSHRAPAFATCLSPMLSRVGRHKYHVFNALALPHRYRSAVPTGTLQGGGPGNQIAQVTCGAVRSLAQAFSERIV